MFRYCFEIAGITIALHTDRKITVSERFLPFQRTKFSACDYEVIFHQVRELPDLPEQWLRQEQAFDVGRDAQGNYFRRFRDMRYDNRIYAAAFYDWKRRCVDVKYLSCGENNLNQTDNCFFHIAWETILQLENCMILHACGIDTAYGGILFSGKSGIGKSTQGELWRRYEGAVMVNGDRPLIKKEEAVWYAYGAPYAGSSRCHLDMRTPIHAVVMLKQDTQCRVRKLKPDEAFRSIYKGMTISTWNSECIRNSCDLAQSLALEIPVFELTCTPDWRAVELLKKTLRMEECV